MTNLTDIELMERIKEEDLSALNELFYRYSPLVYSLINKIIKNEERALVLTNEVFNLIWKNIKKFNFNTGSSFTYILTLSRNLAIQEIRNDKVEESEKTEELYTNLIPFLSPLIQSLDYAQAINYKQEINTALNKLTDAQQYVIYLAYYDGLKENEIASKLNIPLATVKMKVKTAINNLRENFLRELY